MEHPKDVGDRSTLAIILALRQVGYGILLPFGENTRYDLAIERDRELFLVQCKTGRLEAGAVRFKTASSYYHHASPRTPAKHYRGQIDFFAVYCAETGGVYLVPTDDVDASTRAALRIDPPRNNQRERIRFAADYEIGRVAIGGLRASSGA
jgi:PD-(D/E)XK endonuclease